MGSIKSPRFSAKKLSRQPDPKRFPEQLQWVEPWQAKRIMWNTFAFNRQQELESEKLPSKIVVDPGDYDPVLGHSYAEIAGMSRSLHRSQGQGTPQRRGTAKNFLVTVEGDPAKQDTSNGEDEPSCRRSFAASASRW